VTPPLMVVAMVLTGSHYIVHGIVGGVIVLAGLGIATAIRNWAEEQHPRRVLCHRWRSVRLAS
jgi:hypothetical protein